MFTTAYLASAPLSHRALASGLLLSQPSEGALPRLSEPVLTLPRRERVRLLAYGSPRAIRHTIHQLHQLGYVDHFRWNRIRPVPENGIYISPTEAEAYSFLLRELLINE